MLRDYSTLCGTWEDERHPEWPCSEIKPLSQGDLSLTNLLGKITTLECPLDLLLLIPRPINQLYPLQVTGALHESLVLRETYCSSAPLAQHAIQTALSPIVQIQNGAFYCSNSQLILPLGEVPGRKGPLKSRSLFQLQCKERLDQVSEDPSKLSGRLQTLTSFWLIMVWCPVHLGHLLYFRWKTKNPTRS